MWGCSGECWGQGPSSAGQAGFPPPGDRNTEKGTRKGPNQQEGAGVTRSPPRVWGLWAADGCLPPLGRVPLPVCPPHSISPRAPSMAEGEEGGRPNPAAPTPGRVGAPRRAQGRRWRWLRPAEPRGAEAGGARGGHFVALIPGGSPGEPCDGREGQMKPVFTSPGLVAASSSSKRSSLTRHDAGAIFEGRCYGKTKVSLLPRPENGSVASPTVAVTPFAASPGGARGGLRVPGRWAPGEGFRWRGVGPSSHVPAEGTLLGAANTSVQHLSISVPAGAGSLRGPPSPVNWDEGELEVWTRVPLCPQHLAGNETGSYSTSSSSTPPRPPARLRALLGCLPAGTGHASRPGEETSRILSRSPWEEEKTPPRTPGAQARWSWLVVGSAWPGSSCLHHCCPLVLPASPLLPVPGQTGGTGEGLGGGLLLQGAWCR